MKKKSAFIIKIILKSIGIIWVGLLTAFLVIVLIISFLFKLKLETIGSILAIGIAASIAAAVIIYFAGLKITQNSNMMKFGKYEKMFEENGVLTKKSEAEIIEKLKKCTVIDDKNRYIMLLTTHYVNIDNLDEARKCISNYSPTATDNEASKFYYGQYIMLYFQILIAQKDIATADYIYNSNSLLFNEYSNHREVGINIPIRCVLVKYFLLHMDIANAYAMLEYAPEPENNNQKILLSSTKALAFAYAGRYNEAEQLLNEAESIAENFDESLIIKDYRKKINDLI